MSKQKWLVTVLITILVLVVLAAGGYALYRIGYNHGLQANVRENQIPQRFMGEQMFRHPGLNLRGFDRGFMLMDRGFRGLPVLSWLGLALRVVAVIVGIWLLYILIKFLFGKQGWSFTVQKGPVESKKEIEDQNQSQEPQ
jgi:hypothetical protein